MGLFDKINGPIFLKGDSEAERQLIELQELRKTAANTLAEELDQEIRQVNAGIYGEKAVKYELENSHIPMIVLHDLFLEHEGLTAQIDYLIFTRKQQFVLECKNLFGNIEINAAGDFIRTISLGRSTKKEGIYSPITQNRRHLELIKKIRHAEKKNFLTRAIFEKEFYNNYRSLVVLANPKTILNARYAKKAVRDQVIRVDQLVSYIRRANADPKRGASSQKDMEALAQFFLSIHQQPKMDYVAKFREAANLKAEPVENAESTAAPTAASDSAVILCPKCGAPMILRKARQGSNAGKEFYGCTTYPKCRGIVQVQ